MAINTYLAPQYKTPSNASGIIPYKTKFWREKFLANELSAIIGG